MAAIHVSTPHPRIAGACSGLWATTRVYFEHDEATAVAAIIAAIGAAAATAGLVGVAVAAVCADRANEIMSNNGPRGVKIKMEAPAVALPAGCNPEVKYITGRF